jgi:hypothetical protein
VLTAREALVKLDIDAGHLVLRERHMRTRLRRAGFRLVRVTKRRSPSGTGWHLVATVAPRPDRPETVVALQLLLGSDPLREACNLRRARVLDRMPTWARGAWNQLFVNPRRQRCS